MNPAAAPLQGIRVLDFTTFLSGPFCTQMLADLGAEVIKVEPPEGDASRAIPPHFVGDDSAYYLHANRGKHCIVLDLKLAEGLDLAQQLVRQVDVVVENFRPGVAQRLGLDPQALLDAHAGLLWASISGFGQHGPRREAPAYDMIVQALSGVMSLTGEPGRMPLRLGIPAGDLVAGLYAGVGILAALRTPRPQRCSQWIDVAMLDGLLATLSYQATYTLLAGRSPPPQGAAHDSIPTYRAFTAADGQRLVVTANTERMWRALCAVLGREALVAEPRFADGAARLVHRDVLWPLLEAAFLEREAHDWVARLVAAGVPAAPIASVADALAEARDAGRDMVLDLRHDDGRRVQVVGNPIKYRGQQPPAPRYPGRLGEDTEALLQRLLGLPRQEIEQLRARGALGHPIAPKDHP